MNHNLKILLLMPSLLALSSCISTAEGIIDGVAAQGAKGLAVAVIDVDKERCTADPYIVGKVVMWESQLSEEVSISRISKACARKFDIEVDTAEISRGYRFELDKRCDATLVRPEQTNVHSKLTQVELCKQLPKYQGLVR